MSTELSPPTVSLPARDSPAAAPWLLVLEERSSRRISLPRDGALRIGRAPESEVQLADGATSRRHARLIMTGGCARIEDLGSHNGTAVNGRRIDGAADLAPGDLITICDTVLVIHGVAHSPPPSRVLSASILRRRIPEELDRARRYERQVALVVLSLPADLDEAAAAEAAVAALRPFDQLAPSRPGGLTRPAPNITRTSRATRRSR